ncbi:MAG: ABC transporter ATP-binding protein [Bdellovibrionaceae bacterium]|nr:ABC transporter ATP-binding protein [Bdellovibrionales bacterium]MCB9254251.1 ABC transporter ATP-binding protein [Pseudobdellovibrionaceae bacterium]
MSNKSLAGPALEIEHLTKAYSGSVVVDDLCLRIESGEIYGLLGPNGAGKSTTINLITGVAKMQKGSVRVFGYDTVKNYRETRRLIGVMHQEVVFDPFFSVGKALRIHSGYYGVKDDPKWRELLIEKLALGPHVDKKIHKLSGGMKRRFMVAKALVHKPALLILDEPTAGVDVELRRALWDFVSLINKEGTTVVLTTHYLEEAEQMCDRIAILNKGKVVAVDSTANLMKQVERRTLKVWLDKETSTLPASLDEFRPSSEENGRVWRFCLAGQQHSGQVLQVLFSERIGVREVETHSPSLEDVFVNITGIDRTETKAK